MDSFMETYDGNDNTHVLVFPYPAQGHMIPLLDLTHQLAKRGLSITILVTPKNLPLLNPLLQAVPSIQTLVLPFPNYPSLPRGLENAMDLPPTQFVHMIRALGDLHDPLLEWFKSHPSPPVAIISDVFLGWTYNLACELGIRRVVFSPSGALALSVIYNLWLNMPEIRQDEPTSFPDIPGYPKYTRSQISPIYRSYRAGDPVLEFVKDGFVADVASWGLVVYSFNELEGAYLEYLKKKLGHDRVWAIIPPHRLSDRGGASSMAFDKIKGFLDTCQDQSVVYVSFGSHAVLTNDQMAAVASSLAKSGVHFVWSVKSGLIPSWFEDRTAGKGLVIKGWAPQVSILCHPGVGAFMTHCGWNSTLESLAAGVPMLVWPMGAEQFVNAGLVVDELKVGKRVSEGAQNVPNSDELAKAFLESVNDFRFERERVRKIRKKAMDSIGGGSCVQNLENFIKHAAEGNLQSI